jgi:hypothetical protein
VIKIQRRFVFALHIFGALFVLALFPVIAFQAGDWHWPYIVQAIDVAPDPVERGGVLKIYATRTYLDNCDLRFERRVESVADPDHPPIILPLEETATPWRFNGRPQTLAVSIPKSFPCGSAQIRTVPTAACNWLQSYFPQRQRDALTPFEVSCDG